MLTELATTVASQATQLHTRVDCSYFLHFSSKACSTSKSLVLDAVLTARQEVRVLNKDGLVSTWDPPDLISIAANCCSRLALVHSNAVTVLRINSTSGQVDLLQTLHYPQQVSAIAILESPDCMSQVRLPFSIVFYGALLFDFFCEYAGV